MHYYELKILAIISVFFIMAQLTNLESYRRRPSEFKYVTGIFLAVAIVCSLLLLAVDCALIALTR